jgi:hypothetical protein
MSRIKIDRQAFRSASRLVTTERMLLVSLFLVSLCLPESCLPGSCLLETVGISVTHGSGTPGTPESLTPEKTGSRLAPATAETTGYLKTPGRRDPENSPRPLVARRNPTRGMPVDRSESGPGVLSHHLGGASMPFPSGTPGRPGIGRPKDPLVKSPDRLASMSFRPRRRPLRLNATPLAILSTQTAYVRWRPTRSSTPHGPLS